ncbi:arsenate reductase/protein-tyrosine-phosphatase family protein [Mangrovihabitans endophyticus]|uniref:protein-tyrosine-phosphatase n=1 Tax=Mangrovihabitans endophyticus TaxID=1751298 RepID=A0A8J3FR53_9ACTN|nr:low molecular weight phosphatase family protein [Mangrovihabitans endophyticus]GGL12990.1 protein-tyrosine-phosphatase [Mangrovihabitans endophyticus]
MRDSDDQFRLLFVCHANLCRSPLAERLARRAFDDAVGAEAAGVVVSSAGTHAYPGSPMHENSAAVLDECGIDADGFASRTVDEALLAASDLVLTAGREQRAACVSLAPVVTRRAYTLRQFARLSGAAGGVSQDGSPADRMRALVDEAAAVRHRVPAGTAADDDLPDPVGRPVEDFRVCARDIWASLSTIVGVIGGA